MLPLARHADGDARQIDAASRDDSLRGDQLTESFSGHDHRVGGHAARELRGNRVRPGSLRRARSSRDLDAARAFEFRQQFLKRAAEPT
jgi:hypothetical protein